MHPILRRLESLRRREHECTVLMIEALVECERTRAYLDLGHPTLWRFLVDHLHYAHASAWRRVGAVRCVRACPQVLELLRAHRTNLCCLAKAAAVLDDVDDPARFLLGLDGLPQSEVERRIAALRPTALPRESIRRCFVDATAPESEAELFAVAANASPEGDARSTPGAIDASTAPPARTAASTSTVEVTTTSPLDRSAGPTARRAEDPAPPSRERIALRFSIEARDLERLERAKSILSRKHPRGVSLETMLRELLDVFLHTHDPIERAARRPRQRARARNDADADARVAAPTVASRHADAPHPPHRSRHVPRALRDAVFARDGHRCTFVGTDGHRCPSTHDLQLDHVHAFAWGGPHTLENLRVLCARHNRHRARSMRAHE